MPEKQSPIPIEPEAVEKITYWKNQVHFLAEPGVILMIVGVAIVSWHLSGWHKAGIIETTKAELALSKAQLDASVSSANQAIEQMKELGLALAAPMFDELAADKLIMGEAASLEENVAHMQNIVNRLQELGASPEQINAIRLNMDRSVMRNLRRRVTVRLQTTNKNKASLFKHVSHMYKWNKEQFERFIQENNLEVPPEVNDNLAKLEYFTANKKLPKDR